MKKFPVIVLLLTVVLAGCSSTSKPSLSEEQRNKASELNTELGLRYMAQGKLDWSMTKLTKALEQNDDNARAHHFMAELQRRLGQYDKAESHFKYALSLTPDNASLLNNYGIFQCDLKHYKEADEYFKRALEDPLYKDKGGVYENMGNCSLERGDKFEAETAFLQAIKFNPEASSALIGLAQIAYSKKLYTQSKNYYYQFLKVSNHNAKSLWLGLLLERRSGNRARVANYAMRLKGKFPDSPEARLLRRLEAQGRL